MENDLTIVVWNVEHGTAIFVRTPNQRAIMLDAGSSQSFSPALWLRNQYHVERIHLLILSHADSDHITDLENVDQYISPFTFLRNRYVPYDRIYPTFPPTVNPLKHYYTFDQRYTADLSPDSPFLFDQISNWGGVQINSFYNSFPENDFIKLNDYSVVTVLEYGNLKFIYPGDLESPGWEKLLTNPWFRSTCTPSFTNPNERRLLVASHHGRKEGFYSPFLELFRPHLTIISDKFGVEYTASTEYIDASGGLSVFDSGDRTSRIRYTVSTKINNYISISANSSDVFVKI